MALIPIPDSWRQKVCAILEEGKLGSEIQWTRDAQQRFEADGAAAKMQSGSNDPVWQYEAHHALQAYLGAGQPVGCQVCMEKPAGVCYEFLFPLMGRRFYGKILLCSEGQRLVVFSAHRPLKDKLSCE